jgi:hypothetical protein
MRVPVHLPHSVQHLTTRDTPIPAELISVTRKPNPEANGTTWAALFKAPFAERTATADKLLSFVKEDELCRLRATCNVSQHTIFLTAWALALQSGSNEKKGSQIEGIHPHRERDA